MTLISLAKWFAYKVKIIDEEKDVRSTKLEELMGSLCTFEKNLKEKKGEKKNKTIAI